MTQALANTNINFIKLGYDAGNININRLINLDLNSHTAGDITYIFDETGEVSLLNSGTSTTINSLTVTAPPHGTYNLASGLTVNGVTNINNVAVGTFNTKAQHNGKVVVKDSDGGSVNFTGATVNDGIDINPESRALQPVIIKGDAPLVSDTGNATVRLLGNTPKVLLEGKAHDVWVGAPNSEFVVSVEGEASKITIDETAKGSKITTSNFTNLNFFSMKGKQCLIWQVVDFLVTKKFV